MKNGRGEERVRCMERTWRYTLPYVKQIATQICCMAQEMQTGALYQPRGVGLEGWDWKGDGRDVQKDISIPMAC